MGSLRLKCVIGKRDMMVFSCLAVVVVESELLNLVTPTQK